MTGIIKVIKGKLVAIPDKKEKSNSWLKMYWPWVLIYTAVFIGIFYLFIEAWQEWDKSYEPVGITKGDLKR